MISRSAYAQLALPPAGAARHPRRAGAGLWRAAGLRAVRERRGAVGRGRRLGADGALLPADAALLPPLAVVGRGAAGDRRFLRRLHPAIGLAARIGDAAGCGRAGHRHLGDESADRATPHLQPATLASGKGHRDENFPVALVADPAASCARRSSPSTASPAPPTTSPITRALRPPTSSRCSPPCAPGSPAAGAARARRSRCVARWRSAGLDPSHAQRAARRLRAAT